MYGETTLHPSTVNGLAPNARHSVSPGPSATRSAGVDASAVRGPDATTSGGIASAALRSITSTAAGVAHSTRSGAKASFTTRVAPAAGSMRTLRTAADARTASA